MSERGELAPINPVRELHDILARFTAVKQDNLGEAWAATLGAEDLDTIGFFEEMAKFYRLLARAEKDALRAAEDADPSSRVQSTMRALRKHLNSMNFNARSDTLTKNIQPLLPMLELIASLVEKDDEDLPRVDDELLSSLAEDLEGVQERVLSSDLDHRFKDLLVRRIQALRSAILEIRLRGFEDAEAAIDAAFAALAFSPAPSDDPKLTERIVDILRSAAFAIGYRVAANMLTSEGAREALSEGVNKLLGP